MKNQKLIVAMMVLLLVPCKGFSQDWLKKLGKAIETTEKVVEAVKGNKSKGNDSGAALKASEDAGAVEEVATVGDVNLSAQRAGTFRLITHHPDFKVKVKRCAASGKTCVIDMIIENIGDEDVTMYYGEQHHRLAYDDEANQYTEISPRIGNVMKGTWNESIRLLAHVPMKARIMIENVSTSATMFRRLEVKLICSAWNIEDDKYLTFMNLPISREGEE